MTNVLKIMLFSGLILKHRNLFLVSMGDPSSLPFKKGRVPPIDRNKCLCSEVVTQGLVIIHVNILSMHKHTCIQGLTRLDVQWIQCRVNVEKKNSVTVRSMWKKNSVTVIIITNGDTIFFPHWPYILFIECRVPVVDTLFTSARFKSCLFFKFLLIIYSKPCLVQLPRPYSFQKMSWPLLDYLLWRRSGRFCQEFARVENAMGHKVKVTAPPLKNGSS